MQSFFFAACLKKSCDYSGSNGNIIPGISTLLGCQQQCQLPAANCAAFTHVSNLNECYLKVARAVYPIPDVITNNCGLKFCEGEIFQFYFFCSLTLTSILRMIWCLHFLLKHSNISSLFYNVQKVTAWNMWRHSMEMTWQWRCRRLKQGLSVSLSAR